MLRKASELKGFKLGARDGEIGRTRDFYFDDQHWTVRYLVADTGTWLPGRKVLISPIAIKGIHEPHDKVVEVDLDKQQIEQSPSIDEDQPVSRQYESRYYQYYNWPYYGYGPSLWGPVPYPQSYGYAPGTAPTPPPMEDTGDPHLRSMMEVTGYHIQGFDHEVGHVEDFIIDDHTWTIRYLVVDTRNWWPGKKVLLSPEWVSEVDWNQSKVHVDLNRDVIKQAPEYFSTAPITRDYETQLFAHYHREGYWNRTRVLTTH